MHREGRLLAEGYRKMRLKAVSGIMLTLLLLGLLPLGFDILPVTTGSTRIIVPDDYAKIQWAIDSASDGDTIFVKEGTYYEHVVIDKIVSLIGENRKTTIIEGSGSGSLLMLEANGIKVTGFTLRNGSMAIDVASYGDFLITNNTIIENRFGLSFRDCYPSSKLRNNDFANNTYNLWIDYRYIHDIDTSNNVNGKPIYYWVGERDRQVPNDAGYVGIVNSENITVKNLILKNNHEGVLLADTTDSTVENLTIFDTEIGVRLDQSSKNTVRKNSITNLSFAGVLLYSDWSEIGSDHNTISENIISNSFYGIALGFRALFNLIKGNQINSTSRGISIGPWHTMGYSSYNVISQNIVSNNIEGITLWETQGNTFFENTLLTNRYGVFADSGTVGYSKDNLFYHNNFVKNTIQVYNGTHPWRNETASNVWNNDYPSGGNYWSDYTGVDVKTGPNQDEPSSDTIGDTPYVIDANNTDNYPLMYPWGSPPPPSHSLTVYSSPTGVMFTVDNVSRTTPWSETYSENTSVSLVMPETHNGYVWSHWLEDRDTNRTKTVTMNTNITLTGVFTFVPPSATVDIDPNTLNLKSKGRWITCYIELPEGYDVSDIDRATILLNDTIPVDPFWVDKPLGSVVGDYDDDGIPDLMVKFNRAAVIEYFLNQNITYGNVTLTVTGELYDGTLFEGSDMIMAKMPSKAIEKIPSEIDSDDEYVPVMPEFPSFLILPLFMLATLLAVIAYMHACNGRKEVMLC